MGRVGKGKQLARQAVGGRRALAAGMSLAMKTLVADMVTRIGEQAEQNVLFYHWIGVQVNRVRSDPDSFLTPEQAADRRDPVEILQAAIGLSIESVRKAVQFSSMYSEDEVKQLMKRRSNRDPKFRLQWSHIIYLITVSDNKQREEYQRKIFDECLTADDLHKMIVKKLGKRRSGGRILGIPSTVPRQLEQVVDMTSSWLRRHNTVWNGTSHSVYANVLNTPPDKYTVETLSQLERVSSTLQSVRDAATTDLASCDRTIEHVRAALVKSGAIVEPETAAEEASAEPKVSEGATQVGSPTAVTRVPLSGRGARRPINANAIMAAAASRAATSKRPVPAK